MSIFHAPFAAPHVEEIPVAIWVGKAPDGEGVYANAACLALFAVPGSEGPSGASTGDTAPMTSPSDFSSQPSAAPAVCPALMRKIDAMARVPFQRALAANAVVSVDDLVHERAGGSHGRLRAMARPIADPRGDISRVIVAFWEAAAPGPEPAKPDTAAQIASLQRALDDCRQVAILHERLRDAVNHAPLIVFAIDRDGVIRLAQGKALSLVRRAPGQSVGHSVYELYRDHPIALRNVERALHGESFTDLVELGPYVFETWYAPIPGPEGGVLGVANDVTERRRMQATLLSAERMVAVGTIAASVAHEINNPLSYVIACLELLMRDSHSVLELASLLAARYTEDPDVQRLVFELDRAREPFENIRDGIERMRLIARDLRTFARADDHDLTPIDVRDVLRSAIRMSSNETRYRASVVTDFAPVPWVMGSEPRLAQVFLNLLVNAAQAFSDEARPGSCEIRISTAVDAKGRVVVEVRDNGPGIDPGILPRIFEPFFTTKPVGVGTGLGLSVCRNIVVSYGGEIRAQSELGKGSAFIVTLPAAAGPPAASSKRQSASPSVRAARVLVIDDDKVLGNAFRMTLSRDFDVHVVSSGAEALQLLSEDSSYDFVFCDLMMPEMSGMDFFAELSRRKPDMTSKVLFMTGGVYSPEVRAFISRVPNRCLQKPFDPVVVIREALARRK